MADVKNPGTAAVLSAAQRPAYADAQAWLGSKQKDERT